MDDETFKRLSRLRPFDPELDQPIQLPNNRKATEYTTTSKLPSGEFVVHPQIWFNDEGKPTFLKGEQSLPVVEMLEAFGNSPFPRFKNVQDADNYARGRSNSKGKKGLKKGM